MYQRVRIIIYICILVFLGLITNIFAQQVGLIPVPILTNIQVQAGTTFDSATGLYTYSYTFTNPATNTGEIFMIDVDISQPTPGQIFSSQGLTIPRGNKTRTFEEVLAMRRKPAPMVPIGMQVPPGWTGGLGPTGFASFGSGDPLTIGTDKITPGEIQGGFKIISPGMPSIRQIELIPDWVLLVETEEDVTPEMEQRAREIEASLPFRHKTLGPAGVRPGSYEHWNLLRDDISQAIQLVWIPDTGLANTLVAQLASARQALDAQDGTLAKTRLKALLATVTQSTPAQRRQEAHDLLLLNVEMLIENTSDTIFPFEPKIIISPEDNRLSLNDLYTLTASVVNLGDPENPPIPGFGIGFQVIEGPHIGQGLNGFTDAEGRLNFSFTGRNLGTDRIMVGEFIEGGIFESRSAKVSWSGGPDLTIDLFIPPLIKAETGVSIVIKDITGSHGKTGAGPSITRYFLSTDKEIDPASDIPVGERHVPSLNPGERSDGGDLEIRLPDDLAAGTYHLGACADIDNIVAELNEVNNCRANQLVAIMERSPNEPPNCTQAKPSLDLLWPPNHKLSSISIQGITDPDIDQITISITSITQDEPTNGLGDGDTSPDGFGIGSPNPQVRSERSGQGNGRVYAIYFKADDGKVESCRGIVKVGVPHDQGKGSNPIDDGQRYDST